MVSPSQRRGAVWLLCERLGMSQWRACEIVGQHRSTQPAGVLTAARVRRASSSVGVSAGPRGVVAPGLGGEPQQSPAPVA
jgi:hypothetical protein